MLSTEPSTQPHLEFVTAPWPPVRLQGGVDEGNAPHEANETEEEAKATRRHPIHGHDTDTPVTDTVTVTQV